LDRIQFDEPDIKKLEREMDFLNEILLRQGDWPHFKDMFSPILRDLRNEGAARIPRNLGQLLHSTWSQHRKKLAKCKQSRDDWSDKCQEAARTGKSFGWLIHLSFEDLMRRRESVTKTTERVAKNADTKASRPNAELDYLIEFLYSRYLEGPLEVVEDESDLKVVCQLSEVYREVPSGAEIIRVTCLPRLGEVGKTELDEFVKMRSTVKKRTTGETSDTEESSPTSSRSLLSDVN
jgi:hypothetical protein